MSTEFDRDLQSAYEEIDSSCAELLSLVRGLSEADLERERRGEWSVRAVLEHVIGSGWVYAGMVAKLRDQTLAASDSGEGPPATVADAAARLEAARRCLRQALDGVDEETFYRMSNPGHQEYSVRSAVADTVLHDRQHLEQVRQILQTG